MSTASLSAAAAVPANLGDIPRQLLWDPASARAQSDTRSAARRHPPSVRLRANIGRAARQGLRQSAAALPCCLLQATAVGLHVWLHAMRVAVWPPVDPENPLAGSLRLQAAAAADLARKSLGRSMRSG